MIKKRYWFDDPVEFAGLYLSGLHLDVLENIKNNVQAHPRSFGIDRRERCFR
jgi:hypothetical protein